MKVVVSGASSLIGSALIRHAVKQGDEVIAIVRPNSKNLNKIEYSEKITFLELDLKDYSQYEGDLSGDVFFHFAWDKTSVFGRDDVDCQLKNVEYTLGAVRLAKKMNCKKFVGAGSQAEFGIVTEKLNGSVPVNPLSGYGVAKYTAGKLSSILTKTLEMEFNWVRILSIYGRYDAKTTLISYLINTLLDGETPSLTKCEQTWDYLFSDDAGEGIYLIGKKGVDGKTYALGSGKGRPLKDYVLDLKNAIDENLTINFGAKEYYKNQPMYLVADRKELFEDTGFVPKTEFIDGIKETIEWVKTTR